MLGFLNKWVQYQTPLVVVPGCMHVFGYIDGTDIALVEGHSSCSSYRFEQTLRSIRPSNGESVNVILLISDLKF